MKSRKHLQLAPTTTQKLVNTPPTSSTRPSPNRSPGARVPALGVRPRRTHASDDQTAEARRKQR